MPTTLTLDAACTSTLCDTLLGSGFDPIAPDESVQFHDSYEDTPSGQDSTQTECTLEVAPPPTFPPAAPVSWGSAATIKVIRSTIFALHSHDLAEGDARSVRVQVIEACGRGAEQLGFSPSVRFSGPVGTLLPDEAAEQLGAVLR